VLFAPKLLLTSAQTGFTFTADGTLDIGNGPVGFRQLAPAIAPLGASVASLTFTGVAANAQLSLAFAFRDNRAVAATVRDSDRSAGQIADDVTGVFLRQLGTATLCQSGSTGQSYSMAITPDGRVITGDRAGGVVSAYDLITGARVRTVTVKPDKAHIPQLVLDPSGSTVYALASAQHPRRANQNAAGTDAELVRLDAATLTITGRLSLGSSRNRSLEMSPDGKTLAIATGLSAGAILVDISSFTIKGQIMPGFRANVATFSPDGTQLAMVGEQIQTFGLDGTAKMDPIPTPLSTGRKVVRAVWPDPSFVWIARGSGGIAKVDLTDPGATPLTDDTKCRLAEVYDGKLYTESCSTPRAIVVLDLADGTQLNQIDGIASLQGHHVVRSPF
jgi:WD40 repeat protein